MTQYYIGLVCMGAGAFNIGLGIRDGTWWMIALGIFACLLPFLNHINIIERNSYYK